MDTEQKEKLATDLYNAELHYKSNFGVRVLEKQTDADKLNLNAYGNFHKSGSIKGMKDKYYGKTALLVRCGNYIYNVTSAPIIYYYYAK